MTGHWLPGFFDSVLNMSDCGQSEMLFRPARKDEIGAVQHAYDRIREHLSRTVDFRHWHTENHPRPTQISEWVDAGELYIATPAETQEKSGEIAGVVVLDHNSADDYEVAQWSVEAADEQVLIVHVLGVAPDYLGTGVSRFLVESAIEAARDRGCLTVRLDVIADNIPAHRLYVKCGFRDLGLHTIRYDGTDLDQFHLYEYVL